MSDLSPVVDVISVRVLARYIVEMGFADGAVKVLDLEPFLWGDAFEPLRDDYGMFCEVEVDADAGTIVWPNGADLSPRVLHAQGRSAVPRLATHGAPFRTEVASMGRPAVTLDRALHMAADAEDDERPRRQS